MVLAHSSDLLPLLPQGFGLSIDCQHPYRGFYTSWKITKMLVLLRNVTKNELKYEHYYIT